MELLAFCPCRYAGLLQHRSLFFGLLAAAIAAVVVLKLPTGLRHWYKNTLAWKGSLCRALFGGVLSGRSVGRQNHRPFPGLNRIHIDPETVQKKFGISANR